MARRPWGVSRQAGNCCREKTGGRIPKAITNSLSAGFRRSGPGLPAGLRSGQSEIGARPLQLDGDLNDTLHSQSIAFGNSRSCLFSVPVRGRLFRESGAGAFFTASGPPCCRPICTQASTSARSHTTQRAARKSAGKRSATFKLVDRRVGQRHDLAQVAAADDAPQERLVGWRRH